MTKKKIIVSLLLLILAVAGLIGGIYLVKQRQEIRKLAAPATTIYFSPSTKTVNVNEIVSFDILANTSENALATIRLDIAYDSTFLQPISLNFNSALLPQSLRPVDLSQSGKITGSAGVTPGSLLSGTDQKVATISFKTLSEAPSGTNISFGSDTSAYSATKAEPVGSNLITSYGEAQINIASSPLSPSPSPTAEPTLTISPNPTTTKTPTATASPTSTVSPTTTPASTPIPTTSPTTTPVISQVGIGESLTTTPTTLITSTPIPTTYPTAATVATTEEELPVSGSIIPTIILLIGGITFIFSFLLII